MELYEKLASIGEGTYGIVLKCRHVDSGKIVAIKKFKESDNDPEIKKTAMREVRMLKLLKHENVVNLIEVFKRNGRLYLVFEHVDHTILNDLESNPHGLPEETIRKCIYQVLRALDYLHERNVIHRDIKPENILVSEHGVVKICDFGFARTLVLGARYTEYIATRWYRSPELLVGDTQYGKGVDVWACGCIFAELLTGLPLFPGDTDIDQLFRIMRNLGQLSLRHYEVFNSNPHFSGVRLPEISRILPLSSRLPRLGHLALNWLEQTLVYDPNERATINSLMTHSYFTSDNFAEIFESQLVRTINMEKDREQAEKIRRRRSRKHMDDQRGMVSRKENLGEFDCLQHRQIVPEGRIPAIPISMSSRQTPKTTFYNTLESKSDVPPIRSNPVRRKESRPLILPKLS